LTGPVALATGMNTSFLSDQQQQQLRFESNKRNSLQLFGVPDSRLQRGKKGECSIECRARTFFYLGHPLIHQSKRTTICRDRHKAQLFITAACVLCIVNCIYLTLLLVVGSRRIDDSCRCWSLAHLAMLLAAIASSFTPTQAVLLKLHFLNKSLLLTSPKA
jgi:hypothetical protein